MTTVSNNSNFAGLFKSPPPFDPKIPYEVPAAVEAAALHYIALDLAVNLAYSTLILMDRNGEGYAVLYERWLEMERECRVALHVLEDAVGPGPGTYPVDSWLVRNVTSRRGGCTLRVEPGLCPWPRETGGRP